MEHPDLPLKVLIADDHPLILAGVRRVLERSEDIEVVGEAHSGPELLALIERRHPQLVLTDLLPMPGVSGAGCIETIRTKWPDVKVVVLSESEDRPLIDATLSAGASAYVLKSVGSTDLASIVRQAASGWVFHATPAASSASGKPEPHAPALTGRERTILEAVAAGLTTAAISERLWVSEHTVKFHLTNIYRKLQVANRAGAVRYALEHHMVAT
jgi:DNA-binding NarL/FixJ family response regulator